MKHEDYKLIPFNDISEDAKNIAISWFEYKPIWFDLANRHKLASDIINYSNAQLAVYKATLEAKVIKNIHNKETVKDILDLMYNT